MLGDTTATYRWFALVYLFGMFLVIPGIIFLLSLAGPVAIYIVFIPFAILILTIVFITQLQKRRPHLLPVKFRSWNFLPKPLRSLEPMDRLVVSCLGNWKWGKKSEDPDLVNLDNIETKWEDSTVAFSGPFSPLGQPVRFADGDTKPNDTKVVIVDSSV